MMAMTPPKLILLEFNELTPSLLERFMSEGRLPNFKRFYEESMVYTTDAEESGDTLNPWVQWVTVHTGLSYEEHGVLRLNEGDKVGKPAVWDLVSANGGKVWVCGSMNVGYERGINGYVLPDPWSISVPAYPASLDAYYRFVQVQVQEHTNDKVPLSKSDYGRFMKFMLSHGLSANTVTTIVSQLAKEKIGEGKWKRAVILDKLQFDVFRSVYKQIKPTFSTFFLNSTAHMQHAYWRHMDPEPFQLKPTEEEQTEYGDAVMFGYEEMDKLVGKFLDLAGDDATLIFSTALSQQPCLIYEESGGKRFYRPREFDKVTAFAGIQDPHKCSPVMSEQFHVFMESEDAATAAEPKLRGLKVNGRNVVGVDREGPTSIFAGITLYDEIADDAILVNAEGKQVKFYDLFYRADTIKSGMHHPDGALWIRTPRRDHRINQERVTLRAVAPTMLQILGIEPPDYMKAAPLDADVESATTA
jgi:hypothetical protein